MRRSLMISTTSSRTTSQQDWWWCLGSRLHSPVLPNSQVLFPANAASYIAMKISPFEKSTVSNIKDLILMVISVVYLHDYSINTVSGLGIILCLISSALFSMPYLQQKDDLTPISQSSSVDLHPEGTSLLDDKKHVLTQNSLSQQIVVEHHENPLVELMPTPAPTPNII